MRRRWWRRVESVDAALFEAQESRTRLDNVLDRLDAAAERLADRIMAEELEDMILLRKERDGDIRRRTRGDPDPPGAADGGAD